MAGVCHGASLSVRKRVAVCCSALVQCVAVCFSALLQCVAV